MVDTADPVSNLRELRDSIDNIDAAIVHMLVERFRSTHAVGKLKAYAILFLASDESSYITGSEIHVDGGAIAI